ncbi:shikimate dehydrogenase [Singulisphaera acidiphila]|uniref:Shikimate dehydrogenase (NADP(+)) n=1 Tax=Singulisphaera acidiphila (strain ATCC BAA-1392 / DSM 18658 / VKM B-2454 / MOB10) TaxID=886293 RepID=L0DQ30_SINAD|nr:shikimate dehydrogenase [Singulisphaera acidiphila]AGA30801.1 shikimate 5-dehydrogenase [Singulisphaera acidiphila DSM 18658]
MSTIRSFKQELVGVFGFPVAENPTQAMIEPAFAAMGLDWRYLTVEVRPEDLGAAVRGARAMNWRGFNCTIPHKVAVIEHLDRLSPAAEKIGAVNCVINQGGEWVGDNTDGKGFLQSVHEVRPIPGLRAVVLGAGGAARAIGVELALAGAKHMTIVNRDRGRGQVLTKLISEKTGVPTDFSDWEERYQVPLGTDLVVNATSIGLYPDVEARVPIDLTTLRPGMIVSDVIPNPPRTWLIREAETRGCQVLDGLGMLVNQGVIGIRLWSGHEPDSNVMRKALESLFLP